MRDLCQIGDTPWRTGAAVGASVFVSAAAGAYAAGAPPGPPSPAPAVPDLVAVVWDAAASDAPWLPPGWGSDAAWPGSGSGPAPDAGAGVADGAWPGSGWAGGAGAAVPDGGWRGSGSASDGAWRGSGSAPDGGWRGSGSAPDGAWRGSGSASDGWQGSAADGGWRGSGSAADGGWQGPGPADDGAWRLGGWRPSWTEDAHADAVRAVRAAIARGDVYQVNVVGHAAAPYSGDPLPALRRLAGLRGARYAGLLTGAGWAIGCASPETLVEVTNGRIVTRPIKGTRPATPAGRRELLDSAKERAEHVMIVDLERNDLARVARTGSVRVDELYAIRRWCDLWQAESVVSAAPAPGLGLAALLRAMAPGGSVTGAPKLAALTEIAALEPVGRGPSMGALGWVGHDRVDLGLTIRTAAADGDRVHLWAGGGITWGSEPDAEVAEAAAKAGPLRAALA